MYEITIHKEGCDNSNFYRTSGEQICLTCGKRYWEHPYCANAQNDSCHGFGSYYLHVLCNGDHVKL